MLRFEVCNTLCRAAISIECLDEARKYCSISESIADQMQLFHTTIYTLRGVIAARGGGYEEAKQYLKALGKLGFQKNFELAQILLDNEERKSVQHFLRACLKSPREHGIESSAEERAQLRDWYQAIAKGDTPLLKFASESYF